MFNGSSVLRVYLLDTVLAMFSHSQALLHLPHENIQKHTEVAYTE